MSTLLHIETATKVCSVALAKDGVLLDIMEYNDDSYSHAEKLTVFIEEIVKKNKLSFHEMDAVAISEGPGSYTGLRIGTSTAKGICYAANIPLIAVNTLESLCYLTSVEEGIKIPMIDARRMEVFLNVFDAQNKELKKQTNEIITKESFDAYDNQMVYLFGDGAEKLKPLFTEKENIHFIDAIACSAKGMISIAYQKFMAKDFVDVAYFEPNYGKEFYTTATISQ